MREAVSGLLHQHEAQVLCSSAIKRFLGKLTELTTMFILTLIILALLFCCMRDFMHVRAHAHTHTHTHTHTKTFFMPFCMTVPCQFTPLLNLCPPLIALMLFGWFISFKPFFLMGISYFISFIHSFSILSDDRSKASSKTMPPHSAIQSFLLQMRVSSPVLKVVQ